jgi:hypothetical protein
MSNFIEDVRLNQVIPPTQRGFEPSLWEKVKNDETVSDRDRHFAEAGLFFFNQLEKLRSQWPETFDPFAQSPGESIRLIVGFQNRRFRKIQSAPDATVQSARKPAFLESLMMSAEVPDDMFGSIRADDSLPVDTVSLIVRQLIGAKGDKNQDAAVMPDNLAVEMRVKELFRLGAIYTYLQELWSECQWADAHLDSQVAPPVMRLRQSDWGERSTISEYRIRSVRIEQTLIAAEPWKNPENPSRNAKWLKPEITFRDIGQVLHPDVKDTPLKVEELPMDIIHAEVYQRFYNDNLLTQKLPGLEKLTIKQLLIGRRVLAAIGDALQARLLSEPALPPRELFFFAAPLISHRSLENAVHKVLPNLPTKAVKTLVSSFIFGGSNVKARDLWFRPLIDLGGDHLVALAEPLIGLNLELAIDDWSSKGKLYTAKGVQFEARLRRELGTIAETGRIQDAQVWEDSIKKLRTCKDACGDIDLLVKIGRTILVGEVKTLSFPLRALGIYNNLEEIRTACGQAARKAKAVAECIAEVLELTGFGPRTDTENWRVVPFVVSNQAIGVGSSFDDVPVVDRMILESYLGQGGYFPTARLGPGGTIADKGPFVSYYDDDTQAEERVEEYLQNPPAVRRYEQFCEPCRIPFEPFDDQLIVERVQLDLVKLNSTIIET